MATPPKCIVCKKGAMYDSEFCSEHIKTREEKGHEWRSIKVTKNGETYPLGTLVDLLEHQLAERDEHIGKLREALKEFGDHDPTCETTFINWDCHVGTLHPDRMKRCNCEFGKVLAIPNDGTAVREYRDAREKYNELILAVENKYEGESRHETALRLISEAQKSGSVGSSKGTPSEGGK